MDNLIAVGDSPVDLLHEIGVRLATAGGFHEVLGRVVEFATVLVKCDSCLIYVMEGEELVLRASKNAHPDVVDRLKLRVGQGITGWVAEHHEPVLSVPLMCRGRVMGAINVQHRRPHVHKRKEIRLISAIGFLVGAEIELARMEEVNSNLTEQLQTRKVVERAKGILQRELGLSEEQAYLALQRQSRQKRKAMREIAEAIILSEEVRENTRGPGGS